MKSINFSGTKLSNNELKQLFGGGRAARALYGCPDDEVKCIAHCKWTYGAVGYCVQNYCHCNIIHP